MLNIRIGFISNSSSTSFLLCYKDLGLLENQIIKSLKDDKNFDPYKMIAKQILKNSTEINNENIDEHHKQDLYDLINFDISETLKKGFKILKCESDSWEDSLLALVSRCKIDLSTNTNDVIIKQIWEC